MDKRRTRLDRDRLHGRGQVSLLSNLFAANSYCAILSARHAARPLGIEIVTHRENLKFVAGERDLHDEASRMEIVLHSFNVSME